jgi:SMI1-KNR4 cell-wall
MGLFNKLFGNKDPRFTELIKQISSRDSDFEAFGAGNDAPDDKRLDDAESFLKCKFPSVYRDFQKKYGGFYIHVKEEVWPRAKAYEVGPYWSFIYGFVVLGFGGNDIPDNLNILKATEKFRSEDQNSDLIPFLKELGSADYYCFTADGKIVFWNHEGERLPQETDFCSLVLEKIKKLQTNKERKKKLLAGEKNV